LLSGDDYTDFILSINAIKTAIKQWESKPNQTLKKIPGYKRGKNRYEGNPVYLLNKTLSKCPDEFPSSETAELLFIKDEDFRENLRIDISAVNSALSNGEWKSATVLAGSVIEALLLYKLKEKSNNENLNICCLDKLIDKAKEKSIIKNNTVKQAKLAKDFRNLIHSGSEIRKNKSVIGVRL